jgi:uncharacterized protein YhaN
VRLLSLRVEGFGKLAGVQVDFDPRFNVVFGPNEAGKSTLTAAIIATLYGFARGDRERWAPWSGARYATTLTYALADGRTFEVQREFDRDPKGVRVFDANGGDASAECSIGKAIVPGYAHLGVPHEVLVNASFVAQGCVQIDGARAERISAALAQALDGGPREDAALGALKRLDDARALYVGRKRATVNAPLRRLNEDIEESDRRAAEMRALLRGLDDVRVRMEQEAQRANELEAALREHERRGRALRAHAIRSRLDALREIRSDLAALHGDRATYDDVEGFRSERVPALEEAYRTWHTADALAIAHAREAAGARLGPAQVAELDERRSDGGALGDVLFADLEAAGRQATEARDRATFAANEVQGARRRVDGGSGLLGAALASGIFVAVGAAVLALFGDWTLFALVAALALVLFGFAFSRWHRRYDAMRTIVTMQQTADRATALEREAAAKVASVLEPLGASSIDELAGRRRRARELAEKKAEAGRLAAQAARARAEADAAAFAFDVVAADLIAPGSSRASGLAAAKAREARKSARDGIDVRLSMLEVRRNDVLGEDDEYALEREYEELLAAGVIPSPLDGAVSARAFEAERADIERRYHEVRLAATASAAELRTAETQIGDLAALDERSAELRAKAARLERFDRAVATARQIVEERTRERHQEFALRLADYASRTIALVTAGRYDDVRIDPATLAVRVRAPETGAFVDLDRLSAGTREQAFLVVRLAIGRMLSEGIENAPLLLDDPFAYWDDERIARSLPLIEASGLDAQTIVFSTSRELVEAASARGARIIRFETAREPLGAGA